MNWCIKLQCTKTVRCAAVSSRTQSNITANKCQTEFTMEAKRL